MKFTKLSLIAAIAASTAFAGGDIAPVEPAVAAPVVEKSGWEFSGQGVVYYQTIDAYGAGDLFDQDTSVADAGLQLKAMNKDLFAGIGAGITLNGLTTLGLEHSLVSNVMQTTNRSIKGGWIGEAYLTYAMGNTSLKGGRMTLPAGLSPFAHSENWNVFENTYDAALVVNTDISNTVLVGAWVWRNNTNGYNQFLDGYTPAAPGAHNFLKTAIGIHNSPVNALGYIGGEYADMADFGRTNGDNGVFMVTAQNSSIENLTLTGSYYYGDDFLGLGEALNIWWVDGKYKFSNYELALQGGQVLDSALPKDTTAFGAKISGSFDGFGAYLAYSTVDDGTTGIFNVGGQQTPLYTQMIINEGAIRTDNDTVVVGAHTSLLGGTFGAGYGASRGDVSGYDYDEIDVYYTTDLFDGGNILVGYVNMDDNVRADSNNVVRIVGRYNF
jgi:hypothetical protein